jgi:transcriptional regulator with XRE-family HTH domain
MLTWTEELQGVALYVEQAIGHRIREIREAKGMTQEALGAELAVYLERPWSRQAVSAAEQGKRAFAAVELLALAQALDTPVVSLLRPPVTATTVDMPSGTKLDRNQVLTVIAHRRSLDAQLPAAQEAIRALLYAVVEGKRLRAAAAEHDKAALEELGKLLEQLNERLKVMTDTSRPVRPFAPLPGDDEYPDAVHQIYDPHEFPQGE